MIIRECKMDFDSQVKNYIYIHIWKLRTYNWKICVTSNTFHVPQTSTPIHVLSQGVNTLENKHYVKINIKI